MKPAGRLDFPLRPFLPSDTPALQNLLAASVDELCQDDYTEDQRTAWVAFAEDGEEFRRMLAAMTTLVIEIDGEHLGFAALKDDSEIEMLYVHPDYSGEGVGTALAEALETLADARGAEAITVVSTDTAVGFFEQRGYEAVQRNTVERFGEWLPTTTLSKPLKVKSKEAAS